MLKKAIPHLIAVIVFYLITLLFFSPVYFENQEIRQGDIIQYLGASEELKEYREKMDEEPLWTNSMFGGMPAYLINMEFRVDLIKNVHIAISLGLDHPTNLIFLSFISFYILLLSFGVRSSLAIAGAICFGLNTFSIIGLSAGHNAKIGAVAFMPLVVAGIHLTFKRKKWLGIALTALAVALELRINHLQITYYLVLIIAGYGIMQLLIFYKKRELKKFVIISALLIGSAAFGVGSNLGRILTVVEYSKYSTRGPSDLSSSEDSDIRGLDKDYVFDYSNALLEPLVLFIPNFYGGASQQELDMDSNTGEALKRAGMSGPNLRNQLKSIPTYWGPQRLSAPYYAGAIAVFFMVLGFFFVERKYKIWLGATIIFSVMLSWGNNFEAFNYLVYDYLPGYNKFRSVTFTIIIAIFCINLLGFYGLEKFLTEARSKTVERKFIISFLIAGGFALLVILFAGIGSFRAPVDSQLPDWLVGAIRSDREALMRSDAFRSLIFITLSAAIIWFWMKGKISATAGSIAVILLVSIDIFTVAKRYLDEDNYQKSIKSTFTASPADQRIINQNKGNARVLNLNNPFNESQTSYFHSSIGGYHGAKMGRYQDLIERCISPEIQSLINDLQNNNRQTQNYPVLNMLNTGFFKFGDKANAVLPNPSAYGNAWFVKNVIEVQSPNEEIQITCSEVSQNTAVIDTSQFNLSKSAFSNGNISLAEYSPNRLVYKSSNKGDGLAVFSEIFYPVGWKATINGDETEILRVNYVLRALEIPAGENEIIFTFSPASYHMGNLVMIISSIIILLSVFGAVYLEIKNEKVD